GLEQHLDRMASRAKRLANPAADLVISRVFDAPRELVWKVFTDPQHIKNWWGPKDFTCPYVTVDLRVGGAFHYAMRSPDGKEGWTKVLIREIIPQERLVCSMFFSDKDGNLKTPADYGMPPDFPESMFDVYTFETVEGKKTRLTIQRSKPGELAKK